MRTAQELADEFVAYVIGQDTWVDIKTADITAAIEARDAEHAARRDVLVRALEEIAAYDTDYTVGPSENVNRLQLIAERALDTLTREKR